MCNIVYNARKEHDKRKVQFEMFWYLFKNEKHVGEIILPV